MFTEFKFSPALISQQAADTAATLAATQPGVNAARFAASTIADRLRAKPSSYLQYGPYWWALKGVLRALGEDFGATDDADIRFEYGGGFPAYGAIVAAENFRDYYSKTYLAGTAAFVLDDQGEESYLLFDTDMEIRKLGGKSPLLVAAAIESTEDVAEVVLDAVNAGHGWVTPLPGGIRAKCGGPDRCDICREELRATGRVLDAALTPFSVAFEHEARRWTANVYASDSSGAVDKVKAMQSTGRIGRAIEYSKSVGDSALDSTDYAAPLYIDPNALSVSEMSTTGQIARS